MALDFSDSAGAARKSDLEYIKLEFGTNKFRIVGQIRPRYAYWVDLNGNSIPVECLSFDPDVERFTNIEKDWYKEYFPNEKCVWSYVTQVIDEKDGKLKLCGLKKKLWDQIRDTAKSLGDPTDPENGWTIVVDKKKTGPAKFNVEYALLALECQKTKGPLTAEQKEVYESIKSIDELVPRPTANDQKTFIESNLLKKEKNTDEEATREFEEDIPF
jgi:hypothetical protein